MKLQLPSASLALLSLLPFLAHRVLASDVLDLTGSTFEKEVMGEELALVEFFAPWCGHCKNLAPHYEEAATELKSKKGIKLAKVDCTEQQELCGSYGIQGYPTLKVFRKGEPTDYSGPRKADGIVSYMIKQSLPAVSDVSKADHDRFIKEDKVVLVAYGDSAHPVPQAFLDYANTARDEFLFGQSLDADVPSSLPEGASLPAIVLYKQFDEGFAVLPASEVASASTSSLADFVKSNALPLFDEITPENFGVYAAQGTPIAYVFIDPEQADTLAGLVTDLTPLAKEHKGKMNFVYIDGVKFVEHGKSLNLAGEGYPAFVIQDLADQTKFPLAGVADAKGIKEFVGKYVKGEIKASVKSEAVPDTQGPVYKLVADGWDGLVQDESKDILAEFYAPWCGHCQRLAPTWETLGEKFAADDKVVIAQMDATENDIPPQAGFRVSGFPTIKFRAAGTDEWVDYNGDRSLESLVEFIEENRASEPSGDIDPMAGISKEEVEDVDVEEGDVERDVQEEKALHDEL